jgi:glycosyltransferase involved in cell wall biosynthesis
VLDDTMAVFCPPEDLQAWSEALSKLQGDPSVCRALGDAARAAIGSYTWQARAERALEGLI